MGCGEGMEDGYRRSEVGEEDTRGAVQVKKGVGLLYTSFQLGGHIRGGAEVFRAIIAGRDRLVHSPALTGSLRGRCNIPRLKL